MKGKYKSELWNGDSIMSVGGNMSLDYMLINNPNFNENTENSPTSISDGSSSQ